MFKLNKYLHMLILMTFTIVFIVVYLYYIVRDMKRMYQDFKKQAADVHTLQATVSEIKSAMEMVMYGAAPAAAAAAIAVTATEAAQVTPSPTTNHISNDDTESVESEDIRKLVEDGDDAEEDVPAQAPTAIEEEVAADEHPLTKDAVMSMKLDQLKEVCKKNNLSAKGSRETLITRILTEKNIN
jgi:hypothetical protein